MGLPIDLQRSFAMGRFGKFDPTARGSERALEKVFLHQGTVHAVTVTRAAEGLVVAVTGADGEAVAREIEASLGEDDPAAFAPEHALVAKLHRASHDMRLLRVPWRFDVAASAVLQQRVTTREAWQQWGRIARRYGVPSGALVAFPDAATVARMESWRFEQLGVDPKRTRALLALARDVARRGTFTWTDRARVRRHMLAVPGIGPWTTETTLGYGYGDPDAVPLGDVHLPHVVAWALAGERSGTDERMLVLLEPFRGHRFRVIRLLLARFGTRRAF